MRKKIMGLFGLAALCMLLTGCLVQSMDELYMLPRQSEEYYDLQQAIDTVMTEGTSYAAPSSGSNQQPVQLADLDGDGEDEAIVFLRGSGENPLKLYLFDLVGETFENIAVIEGSGSSFDSVEYVQLDDEPGVEIVVGRQVSDQVLQALGVYSLHGDHVVELMNCNYTEYTVADLTGDGLGDVFVLRFDAEGRTGVAELYTCVDGIMEREPEASMSTGVDSIRRIISGRIENDVPAVLVVSTFEESGIITDVFAMRGDVFTNITSGPGTDLSALTVRNYYVYATDVDSDAQIELPEPQQLTPAEGTEGTDTYWIIHWYSLSIDGTRTRKMTTYHNYSGGWFLVLPDEWLDGLSVSRSEEVSGVRGYVFSHRADTDEPAEEILTIYAFTGDERNTLAQSDGRFILGTKGDTTYAASIGSDVWARKLSEEEVKQRFQYIQIDWNTGEM